MHMPLSASELDAVSGKLAATKGAAYASFAPVRTIVRRLVRVAMPVV
jgi:hypothetical protein